MSTFVLTLSDPRATLEIVGGKGMSLAKLVRAGLPVPGGFHITTLAYRQFVVENGIQPRILDALVGLDLSDANALEEVSCRIRGYFTEGRIPHEIEQAISAACAALQDVPVAVRSSATAEDLPEASFAGQQDTYLNVRGRDAVLEAVKKCWGSLWTARAIAYRARQRIDPDCVALAVVIQELIFAEAAGVLFTANPLNGRRDEIMLTAAWGLGEAVVSGVVTPDTIILSKPKGRLTRRETAEKQVMTVRTESGTSDVPVPASKKRKAVLSNAQTSILASLGLRIENLYGIPMDIEWALTGGKFAILQARPITALPEPPPEWRLPHPKAVMARGSFAEFVPEPVSPLFATLAVPIARNATLNMMRDLGMTEENGYLFAVLNDYVYIGFVFTPKMIWQMTRMSFQMLGPVIRTARQRAVAERANYVSVVQKWKALDPEDLTPSQLLAGVREIFAATAAYYNMAQSGTIPASLTSEAVFSTFYNLLVKRKGGPKAETFLFGTENHSMRSEKGLFDLAIWLKSQPGLAETIACTSAKEVCDALREKPLPVMAFDEFSARFKAYLGEYGHAIYDLDFSKPTPADDPEPLVETLKVYLAGKNNPYERQRAALELGETQSKMISRQLDPLRRKYFLKLLNWARDTGPMREDSIADLGLGHPQIRHMLAELGLRLAEAGAISCTADVYWLEAQEVDAMAVSLENGAVLRNYSSEVKQRASKWQAMRRIIPPTTLPKINWMAGFFPNNEQEGKAIKGFGASAGRVTARACVMLGPEDFGKMQPGDVLVAGITTPAWTPLFARAAAIVTDIGGPLSHSSIVAREYGIPAVLATGVGTRRIKDGQIITVDGSAGTVEINR